jgi:hypothetical protein
MPEKEAIGAGVLYVAPDIRNKGVNKDLRKLIQVSMQEVQDEMRQYDSLGGMMWFRGIEPMIDGKGWMICLGTH